MRIVLLGLAVLFTGCTISPMASESQEQSAATTRTVPVKTGSFVGHYTVPTSADLADAAVFDVPEVKWSCINGVATLHYELPTGLVGGTLSVTLTGPITAGSTVVHLTAANGTGNCTASNSVITCGESFTNLGALPINQAIVVQRAAIEYPGPATDRVAVAQIFSSDPIGTVDLDVTLPSDDGGGGGGGGGHGGHGPH